MGRSVRQFYSGGIYHIVQRGHNKMYIFIEEIDRSVFLDCVKAAREAFGFNLLYYVLMDNHFHLVIEMQSAPIGRIMHRINLSYSKYYNRKYRCSGTIYGERFKAGLVDNAAYFALLIRYVAYNPVKAGLVKRPVEYRWGAHPEVMSRRSGIVSGQRLFEILGGTVEQGTAMYTRLIDQPYDGVNPDQSIKASHHKQRQDQLLTLFDTMLADQRRPVNSVARVHADSVARVHADSVARIRGVRTNVAARSRLSADGPELGQRIRAGCRDRRSVQFRHQFIRLAYEHGFQASEIAHFLNSTTRHLKRSISALTQDSAGHSATLHTEQTGKGGDNGNMEV